MDIKVGSRVVTDYGHGEVTDVGKRGIRTAYRIVGSEYDVWLSADEFDLLDLLFGEEVEPDNEELSVLDLEADPEDDVYFIKEGEEPEFESEFIDRANDNPELSDLSDDEFDVVAVETYDRLDDDPYAEAPAIADEVIDELLPDGTELKKSAAWVDVQNKAREIFSSGRVSVNSLEDRKIEAVVQGATGTYNTMIKKTPGSQKIAFWSCSCPWGEWAFNRETRYGRLCSHALATQYAMQKMEYGKTAAEENSSEGFAAEAPSAQDASIFDTIEEEDVTDIEENEGDFDESSFVTTASEIDEDLELTFDDSYDGEDEELFQSDLQNAKDADSDEWDEEFDENFNEHSQSVEANQKVAEEFNDSQDISHLQQGLEHLMSGGGGADPGDDDISKAAQKFLKDSRKQYTAAEELRLIDEDGTASQLEELDLSNTHYI